MALSFGQARRARRSSTIATGRLFSSSDCVKSRPATKCAPTAPKKSRRDGAIVGHRSRGVVRGRLREIGAAPVRNVVEGKMTHGGRRLDAGQRRQSFLEAAAERVEGLGVPYRAPAKRAGRTACDPTGIRIDAMHPRKRPGDESRSDDEDDAERDLNGHERDARAGLRGLPAALEIPYRRRAQDLGERRQREEHPPQDRRAAGEREHSRVDLRRRDPRETLRPRREERREHPARHQQTRGGAEQGEDEPLRKALREEPSASGAERDPQRDLVPARRGARGEESRDVDAGDEKQDRDAAEEREENGPDLANAVGMEADRVVATAGGAVLGELLRDLRRDAVDLALALRERDAGLQAANDAQELLPARVLGHLGPERRPGLQVVGNGRVRRQEEAERCRHHADDRRRPAAVHHAASHDVRIGAEAAPPERRRRARRSRARRTRRRPRGTCGRGRARRRAR